MTDRAPERLATAVFALVAGAAVVLCFGARRADAEAERSRDFQRIVGGLGHGTATALAPCEAAFDPSIAGTCTRELDPVPGGASFCPHHSGPSIGR